MNEKDLEKNIGNLLKRMRLNEAPEDAATASGNATGNTANATGNTVNAPGNAMPKPEENDLAGAPVDKNLNFSYIDTHTLFYTYPPAGARTWSKSDKKIYKPLQNGLIVKNLIEFLENKSGKKWKYIDDLKALANKYSDYQFRIEIGSKLKMDTIIKFIITEDTTKAILERLEVNTPFQSKNAVFTRDVLKRLPVIELKKFNSSKLFNRLKGSVGYKKGHERLSKGDIEKMVKTTGEKIQNIEGINSATIDRAEKLVNDIAQELSDKDSGYEVHFDPKDSKDINNLVTLAQEIVDKRIDDEGKIAEMLRKNGFIIPSEEKTEESYSLDMESYLKNILIEAEGEPKRKPKEKDPSRKTLEREVGGDLISALDENVVKWFKHPHGITAYGSPPKFEGKIFEFFKATKVDFRAKEREMQTEEQTQDKVVLRLKGYIEAIGYTWFDARIREKGGWNSWTFRIHDNPHKPFYQGTAKIGGSGTGFGRKKDLYKGQGEEGAQFGYKDTEKTG